eukprot:SAG31_NODE_59_length_29571_cov_20.443506_18_plen_217_part_00
MRWQGNSCCSQTRDTPWRPATIKVPNQGHRIVSAVIKEVEVHMHTNLPECRSLEMHPAHETAVKTSTGTYQFRAQNTSTAETMRKQCQQQVCGYFVESKGAVVCGETVQIHGLARPIKGLQMFLQCFQQQGSYIVTNWESRYAQMSITMPKLPHVVGGGNHFVSRTCTMATEFLADTECQNVCQLPIPERVCKQILLVAIGFCNDICTDASCRHRS